MRSAITINQGLNSSGKWPAIAKRSHGTKKARATDVLAAGTKALFCLTLTLSGCHPAIAQDNWIGATVSTTSDIYNIEDPGGFLRSGGSDGGPEISLYWKHTFDTDLYTQLGASVQSYSQYERFKGAKSWAGSLVFTAVKLNADAGYKLPVTRKISFVPRVGLSVAVNTSYYLGSGSGNGRSSFNGTVIEYSFVERGDVNRVFLLANGNFAFEYLLFPSFSVNVSAGYHLGLMKAIVVDVQYSVDQSAPYNATQTSNGDYWDLGIGVAYKISKH